MNAPHKFANIIKAWADGWDIQYKNFSSEHWEDFDEYSNNAPKFHYTNYDWRVKGHNMNISTGKGMILL